MKASCPQTQPVFDLILCLAHPLPSLPLRLIHQRAIVRDQARCGYSVPSDDNCIEMLLFIAISLWWLIDD